MSRLDSYVVVSLSLLVALSSGCSRPPEAPKGPEPAAPPPRNGVSAEDMQRTPNVPIEQVLQGRVAGVQVTRAEDGGIAVRIRGSTSLSGNNAPLYILDGVPFEPGPGGSLTGVNPYDIASIKVLKDPADISMYGVRGANGVIVIKTKRRNQ